MGMDLFCVSPQRQPPVCKILDYGKYKFEKDKKEREAKKNQKKTVIKEIRFTATTDKHDLETKAKATISYLQKGWKVKVAVFIKGRMMQRMDIVKQTLSSFLDMVKDYAVAEKEPELLGKDYFVMLNPKKQEDRKMPKMKSKRGAVKRFKITADGKMKKWNQNTSHLSHNKTHKMIRHNRKARYLNATMTKKMKTLIVK